MTAMVTGAGGAIGSAVCLRLAAAGHPIGVLDVVPDAAATTVAAIEAAGGRGLPLVTDLRDAEAITAAFATAEAALGPVDVLVNNAAIFPLTPFLEVTAAEHDDTIAVNQRAYFLCAQAAARSMAARTPQPGGSIVNVASIVWHGYWIEMAPYVAAKGAIVAMTRALARELGGYEIRVNAVAPGAFPTAGERAQHPDLAAYERRVLDSQALRRRGTMAELASVIAFLAGPESSFVTGQTLNVDGGWVMS
jgi:NAD(P)-dependent dehydrogenase (short-subunit alcohol dehydrogenase family)